MGRKRRGALTIEQERGFFPPLDLVLTPAEICARWGRSKKSVMARIWSGDFVARKSGKTWLVAFKSVVHWWGFPQKENEND
jgi:hypothetical protein